MDFKALAAQAVKENNVNMTEAAAGGGGDYAPPKAGPTTVRLISYVEIGKHKGTYQGKPTNKEYVQLTFELTGPNHQPTVLEDGTKIPHRVVVEETLSLGENSRFLPLARRLLYKGDQQHVIGALGEGYKARVIHRKYAKRGEDKAKPESWTGVAIEFYDRDTKQWTIEPPRREIIDEDTGLGTGEFKAIVVAPPISDLRGFLWNCGDPATLKAMWDSLFIEGSYPERKDAKGNVTAPAKSKNVIQNTIKSATNFVGSPIHALLTADGAEIDIPDAEVPESREPETPASKPAERTIADVPKGQAADDALNGVM